MMIYIKKSGSEELVALRAHKTKKNQLYIIYVTLLYIPFKTLTETILFELPFLLLSIHGTQNSNNKYTISSSEWN